MYKTTNTFKPSTGFSLSIFKFHLHLKTFEISILRENKFLFFRKNKNKNKPSPGIETTQYTQFYKVHNIEMNFTG